MNRKLLILLLFIVASTLSFVFGNTAGAKAKKANITEIGFQKDAEYYYTFYINLGKEETAPLAYVQVQKNSTGAILKLEGFKGDVAYWKGPQFIIKDEVTVSFYDGDKLIEKKLKGVIEGGVKM